MRALSFHGLLTTVELATGITAAAFPPPAGTTANVTAWQGDAGRGGVPEFDLSVSSYLANAITAAECFGAIPRAATIADDDVDAVDFANNELDIATHGLLTGDGPIRLTTTDTLPAGLAADTDYWVIRVAAGAIQLATTRDNAFAGTAVPFTDAGTGTHTIVDTADTQRIRWYSYGQLGHAADGVITLTADGKAYTGRVLHRQRVIEYAFVATFGSAVATDIEITPVIEE